MTTEHVPAPVTLPVTPSAVEAAPQGGVPPPATLGAGQSPAGATVPAVTAAPAGTQPPVSIEPPVSPEIREYVAGLERERAEAQARTAEAQGREDLRELEGAVAQYTQRLQTEQGMTPEQADHIARREGQQALREYREVMFRQGQMNAAFDIAQRMGVDPRTIINLPTPQAMVAAAQRAKALGNVASVVSTLRAENEALKKKLAPVQTFASGAGAGGAVSGPVTRERLASMTPAEYKAWRDNGGVK